MRRRIPVSPTETLYIKKGTTCDVHDWPTFGMAKRLVQKMRDSHPKGVNACRKCLGRAFKDRDAHRQNLSKERNDD